MLRLFSGGVFTGGVFTGRKFAGGIVVLSACLLVFYFFSSSENINQLPESPPTTILDKKCWFELPADLSVRCGSYQQVINDQTANNIALELPFVVFQDSSSDHKNDPLVYLPGGPGSSTGLEAENIHYWFEWVERANLGRDLVLIDQRGTGLSKPQFRCQAYETYVRNVLKENVSQSREQESLNETIEQCVNQYSQSTSSEIQLSTRSSVEDLQGLMEGLAYQQWNVMGASYGTRVALLWADQYPNSIRSMILDSVYPPGKGGLLDWPKNLANSFTKAFELCEITEDCDFNRKQLFDALAYLREKPVTVSISLWHGDWPMDVVVNNHRFLFVAYSSLYRPSRILELSDAIDDLLLGNTDGIQKLVENSVNSDLDPAFNPFTFFAVDCLENYRPNQDEYDEVREQFPLFSNYTQQSVGADVCKNFLSSPLPAIEQLKSTPALFLSGGLDPVTPPTWVTEILDFYEFSQHWVFPELSHGVSANSECAFSSLPAFLNAPKEKIPNPCI